MEVVPPGIKRLFDKYDADNLEIVRQTLFKGSTMSGVGGLGGEGRVTKESEDR